MPGRQSNVLKSREDQRAKQTRKQKPRRGLDAFSIAEKEYPTNPGLRQHRFGEIDDDGNGRKRGSGLSEYNEDEGSRPSKRQRTGDETSESSVEGGSDSEGHEWQIGRVDSEDDSDIDSDEAIGSDEEGDFEGFAFRGSSTNKKPGSKNQRQGKAAARGVNLSEGDDDLEGGSEDGSEEDDLGEDAVDLATAWDMNAEESEAETKPKQRKDNLSDSGSGGEEQPDDQSELSLSDDEGSTDARGLSRLQKFVKSMGAEQADLTNSDAKRNTTIQGSQPTEFGLMPTKKLTVADLMPTISDSRMKGSLKHIDSSLSAKKTSSRGVPGKLEAPLAKRQQDRIDRAAAYEKSKETLGRWIDTVKANRQAEHLSFPLPEPDALQDRPVTDVKPRNDLESTIQNILVESGLADAKAEDKIQEFEELQARKIPLEEIQARRAELRKARDLLFREEVRAKRIKKIKSKAYRRVHRKERERNALKEQEALAAAGVDIGEDERERYDRLRAEARMGAKHRESKWAKSLKQTGRTAWDEDAREGVNELARRGEELQRRIEGKRTIGSDKDYLSSSSEESDEEDVEEDGFDSDAEGRRLNRKLGQLNHEGSEKDAEGPYSGLMSMKFMKNAEAARKAQNEAEIKQLSRQVAGEESEADSSSEEAGRQKFGRSETATSGKGVVAIPLRQEFEEPAFDEGRITKPIESDGEVDIQVNPNTKSKSASVPKHTSGSTNPSGKAKPLATTDTDANPWLSQTTKKGRKPKGIPDESAEITLVENVGTNSQPQHSGVSQKRAQSAKKGSAKQSKKQAAASDTDDSEEQGESRVPVLIKNEDLVKRAFAGDEVVANFEKEKLDTIKDEDDKEVETTLPGWGSWTGSGLSKKDKKRAKRTFETVEGIKPEKRKDAKLDRVIINEKRVKKNVKYLASQLPHPFESRQQYERSLRLPVGPEWTTKNTFQDATKPRVMIKQGIIKPMEKPQI